MSVLQFAPILPLKIRNPPPNVNKERIINLNHKFMLEIKTSSTCVPFVAMILAPI